MAIRTGAVAATAAALVCGIALGERGELGAVQYVFVVTIPAAALVLARWSRTPAAILLTGTAALAGLLFGWWSWNRAYDDCASRDGELVRRALTEFRRRHDTYPARLTQLALPIEPCRAMMRGSILHYAGSEKTYRLWFRERHATHAEAFWSAAAKR